MSRLVFVVPKGRRFCGRAVLLGKDGRVLAGPFRALATASVRVAKKHGNADASSLLPFGHPPSGSYVVAGSLPPGHVHAKRGRRFGRVGALLLRARDGDALLASRNGRGLVAIHGGPRDRSRLLRPTRGGVRMPNNKLEALVRAINAAQLDGDPVVDVTIVEVDTRIAKPRDKRGRRPTKARRQNGSRRRTTTAVPAFLIPFAALDGARGDKPLSRRDLLRAALMVAGAMALEACDHPDESPRCDHYYWHDRSLDGQADGGDAGGDGGVDGGRPNDVVLECDDYRGYIDDPAGGVG